MLMDIEEIIISQVMMRHIKENYKDESVSSVMMEMWHDLTEQIKTLGWQDPAISLPELKDTDDGVLMVLVPTDTIIAKASRKDTSVKECMLEATFDPTTRMFYFNPVGVKRPVLIRGVKAWRIIRPPMVVKEEIQ